VIKAKFCPNRNHLQTKTQAQVEILSEPGSPSDKITGSKRNFVRTRATFGQKHGLKEKLCPNQGHLRTKSRAQSAILSEPRSPSDKNTGTRRNFVRTRVTFGQNHVIKAKYCPNQGHLRTKSRDQSEILSEPESPSDKNTSSSRDFVRTRITFGQNHRLKEKLCPNPGHLRTKTWAQRETLSEPRSPSDKITGSKRNIV
jgi:hypothetical protein